MEYDLEDLDRWEPVLAGVTSKKQLKDEVSKRKESRFLGAADSEPEVCLVRDALRVSVASQVDPLCLC